MKLNKNLTTVTPLSKLIALLLFIFLPIGFFYFGLILGNHGVTFNGEPQTDNSTPEQHISKQLAEVCNEFLGSTGSMVECSQKRVNFLKKQIEIVTDEYRHDIDTNRMEGTQNDREEMISQWNEKLSESNATFVSYLEAQCTLETHRYYGGSIVPVTFNLCTEKLLTNRLIEITSLLQNPN